MHKESQDITQVSLALVPPENRFRSNDLRHLFQRPSAESLADLGQTDPLQIRKRHSPFDLVPENAVLRRQEFVSKQEFVVNRTGDISAQSFPIHPAKVNQGSRPQATFRPPCKSLRTARFEFFDLTGWVGRKLSIHIVLE